MKRSITNSIRRKLNRDWTKILVTIAAGIYIWDEISSSLFAFLATII
jgi:hypothetical protein